MQTCQVTLQMSSRKALPRSLSNVAGSPWEVVKANGGHRRPLNTPRSGAVEGLRTSRVPSWAISWTSNIRSPIRMGRLAYQLSSSVVRVHGPVVTAVQ